MLRRKTKSNILGFTLDDRLARAAYFKRKRNKLRAIFLPGVPSPAPAHRHHPRQNVDSKKKIPKR